MSLAGCVMESYTLISVWHYGCALRLCGGGGDVGGGDGDGGDGGGDAGGDDGGGDGDGGDGAWRWR